MSDIDLARAERRVGYMYVGTSGDVKRIDRDDCVVRKEGVIELTH